MKAVLASLALLSTAPVAVAIPGTIIVNDTFAAPSLDTAAWQVITPFLDSSVEIIDGAAHSNARGILATQAVVPTPYTVFGSFNMPFSDGIFSVSLRSDLMTAGVFGVPTGLSINFVNGGDFIQFHTYDDQGEATTLTENVPFDLENGVSYEFEIIDDGSSVSLFVNGTSVFESVATNFSTGGHIALYGSQTYGIGSDIEAVMITTSAVPEPASFAALSALGALGFAAVRRRAA